VRSRALSAGTAPPAAAPPRERCARLRARPGRPARADSASRARATPSRAARRR
jgi:hypothetical protein